MSAPNSHQCQHLIHTGNELKEQSECIEFTCLVGCLDWQSSPIQPVNTSSLYNSPLFFAVREGHYWGLSTSFRSMLMTLRNKSRAVRYVTENSTPIKKSKNSLLRSGISFFSTNSDKGVLWVAVKLINICCTYCKIMNIFIVHTVKIINLLETVKSWIYCT